MTALKAYVELAANGCWLWHGSHDGYGFPLLSIKGRIYRARNVYYCQKFGVMPVKVDSTCKNRNCVNPDHLIDLDDVDKMIKRYELALSSVGLSERDKGTLLIKLADLRDKQKARGDRSPDENVQSVMPPRPEEQNGETLGATTDASSSTEKRQPSSDGAFTPPD